MIVTNEDMLICDLAETYHVLDYKSLPVKLVATLSVGLRLNSRIKMEIAGLKYETRDILLGCIADRIGLLLWGQSLDGQKGINKPTSILESLMGNTEEKDIVAFDSIEAFKKTYERLTRGEK